VVARNVKTAELPITTTESGTASMSFDLQSRKRKTLGIFERMSSPKISAVNETDIDITGILESEISVNIDNGKKRYRPSSTTNQRSASQPGNQPTHFCDYYAAFCKRHEQAH